MPPPSSLPLHHRDGRAGLLSATSLRQPPNTNINNAGTSANANANTAFAQQAQAHNNEPYYSNEDIELLHEIVTLAESILPSLPERDRLPTNALFQAAEQILPAHGYPDPDQAPSHISRLIFKIGGQRCAPNARGEVSLLDRFRTVLAGMGIMLEYVPSSPLGGSREQSPVGVGWRGGSAEAKARGGLAVPDKAARSRSRSVSVSGRSLGGFSSVFSDDEDMTGEVDIKLRRLLPKRRHSSVSRPVALGGLPIRSRARSASFTDPNALPGDTLRNERARRLEALAQQREQQQREREQLLNRRGRSPEKGQSRRSQLASRSKSSIRGDYGDDGRPFQPHNPVLDKVRHIPRVFGAPSHYENAEVAAGTLPAYARPNKERPRPMSFSSVGETDHNHKSPRTDFSELHRATSDTTVNTKDEPVLPSSHHHAFTRPPSSDPEYQEAKVRMFRTEDDASLLRDAFTSWHDHFNRHQRDHHHLLSLATQIDDEDIKTEVLEIWLEETVAVVEERERREAEAEHEAWVNKMERRATRVYEVFTIRNMLNFWQDQAREELDRTAVARRHLVRKRAFDAWRAQHIQDETKARNFVLIHALQRWTAVALHLEVRRHLA